MKLFIILVAIGLEKFVRIGGVLKRFKWFTLYLNFIESLFKSHAKCLQGWLGLLIFILPIELAVAVCYWLFNDMGFGFVGLMINLLILLYCLGPDDLYHQLRCLLSDKSDKACEQTLMSQLPPEVDLGSEHQLSQAILMLANERFFAVVFWYILLGPLGAVLYRLTVLLRQQSNNGALKLAKLGVPVTFLQQLLDWLPARMTAFFYLLVGSFNSGISHWCQYVFTGLDNNLIILQRCGLSALSVCELDEKAGTLRALDLVEHALIVILGIIAIFTLGAWIV